MPVLKPTDSERIAILEAQIQQLEARLDAAVSVINGHHEELQAYFKLWTELKSILPAAHISPTVYMGESVGICTCQSSLTPPPIV